MFVKRFVAKDKQQALQKIRKDFGSDAVILDSKMIRKKGIAGLFQKKMVEIVAAYDPAEFRKGSKQTDKKPAESNSDNSESSKNVKQINSLSEQVSELKDVVRDFSNKIRVANKETTLTFTSEILGLYNGLIESEVHEEIAKEISQQTQEILGRKAIDINTVAQQLISNKLGESVPLKLKKYKQNVLLFVGPTGAGKTTTLVKLASQLAFNQNLNVGLINMDTYRVGAIEHMKIYSEIMDINMQTAYNTQELKQALKALEDKDVVLIDTAGKSTKDEEYKKELAEYMRVSQADEVFLILSVVTGYRSCRDIVNYYSFVDDFKFIFTKLDEINTWGNILNIADYARKPLSYMTTGQNVPGDICEASVERIVQNIAGRSV